MKKLYSLLFLIVSSVTFGQTIYSENFGTPTGNTAVATYITGTAPATFQNSTPIAYSGTTTPATTPLRVSLPSSGYTGATGNGNVFLSQSSNAGHFFQIDGINTSAFPVATNLQLSFGYNTASTSAAQLIVEKSTNGTTWTPLTFTPSATGWTLVTVTGSQIPSSATLSLRFTQPSTVAVPNTAQFRIDDVRVFNFDPTCTLSLGAPTTACDAVTYGLDTYTVTIPYTGGSAGAYTFTPSSGTVGGDNPATLTAGNIVVTGVIEGNGFTLGITKGTCSYTANAVSAVECKPVNTLPYSESFPYTVGNVLNAEQKWTVVNTSGDNILASAGSLTYAGVTSTGNSVTYSGSGLESFSPFTSTNSGTVYAAFLLNVTELQGVTDGNASYCAAVTDDTKAAKERFFLKRVGEQYQIGLDTATNLDATLRNVGDTVYIVMGYDFTSNALSMWINPTNGAMPTLGINPSTPFVNLGGFLLRQDAANLTPTIVFDELRVVTSLASLGLTLGTKSNDIKGLNVYPNPITNGKLYITSDNGADKTVAIYDILGKQVLTSTVTNDVVNVSGLNAGVYIVKITEDGNTATRKLIIR